MDMRLSTLCNTRDIVYTRYADDLSFSSDNRTQLNRVGRILKEIVEDEGFIINNKKTRFFSNDRKKVITGITINDGESHVDKQFKRRLRAKIYYAVTQADYSESEQIRGMVAFVNSIEEGDKEKIIKYIDSLILKDSLRNQPKLVKAYNDNKWFKELNDMTKKVTT